MAIALVQQALVYASVASPQTFTMTTAGGNTLVVTGHFFNSSVAPAPVSVTDSAGNTWHLSTTAATDPPTQTSGPSGTSEFECDFVAWSVNASAVTSVTVACTGSNFWAVALAEFSGVGSADTGNSATSGASNVSSISASVTCTTTGELIVAAGGTVDGTLTLPAGFTAFTGQFGGQVVAYALSQSGTVTPAWSTTTASPGSIAVKAFAPPTSTVNGTAVITGAGSVAAPAVQGVTAALAGAGIAGGSNTYGSGTYGSGPYGGSGAVAIPVTLITGATITGTGTLAAIPGQRSAAALTGAGTLTAVAGGGTTINGTAALTGAGSLAALATQNAVAVLAGAGVLTASPGSFTNGTAVLTGAGTVAAAGGFAGAAALTAVGTLSAPVVQQAVAALAALGTYGQAGTIRAASNAAVTDPRDGTDTVTRRAASISGVR